MNIFKHKTTINTWIYFVLLSLSLNVYLLWEKWLTFIVSVPLSWAFCMFVYFGLEFIFIKEEVKP
jgi:hypothetical protein